MGLRNFEFIFVLVSVVLVMMTVQLLFSQIYIQYLKLSKKLKQIEMVKPALEYGLIVFIIYKILFQ